MSNQTIYGVSRCLLEKWRRDLDACQRVIWLQGGFDPAYCADAQVCIAEMDKLLTAKSSVPPSSGPAGRRERFEKWVMSKNHPVLGFLDGHWLKRGDDREGYANEYVQGLWVAFNEFDLPPLIKTLHENGDLIAAEATIAQLQQRVAQVEGGGSQWQDMATAPKDGSLLLLLVEFDEHSTEDEKQAPTIGANNFTNDGQDEWTFAGWCWTHDHWTQGVGKPIGWRPLNASSPAAKSFFAKAFTTMESGDGKFRIVAQFEYSDDAWEAYRLICGGVPVKATAPGHCRNGDACVCGGDTDRVRATCGNWVKP